MEINPYVVMTIQLFRVQALAARAVGDADEAEAFEAAIDALLEGTCADPHVALPRAEAWAQATPAIGEAFSA